jgi:osmotically inducible lipoprotein OsmB
MIQTKFQRIIVSVVVVALAGCESYSPTKRDIGALGGAALGAGLGAIVGSEVGDAGPGVAIGAAAGALVGGLVGHTQDEQDVQAGEHEEILQRQQQEIERQQREIEDLRRQQYQDSRLESYRGAGSSDSNTSVKYDSWGSRQQDSGAIQERGLDDSFATEPSRDRY